MRVRIRTISQNFQCPGQDSSSVVLEKASDEAFTHELLEDESVHVFVMDEDGRGAVVCSWLAFSKHAEGRALQNTAVAFWLIEA